MIRRGRLEPRPGQWCWGWEHVIVGRVEHLAGLGEPATLCGLDVVEEFGGECRRGKHCATCREAVAPDYKK